MVRTLLRKGDVYIDLLPQRTFLTYAKQPGRLREELLAHHRKHGRFTCVLDEVQKIPGLLDEVHELIESRGIRFVLTGSSARKLMRTNANLLAGRAYIHRLFPLTVEEMGADFELERALRRGCLPALWGGDEEDPVEFLRSYSETYLREEVAQEGLVRRLGPFSQFLDIVAANDGEIVNYSNVSRECGVSVKTAQQYYEILEQTFLAYKVPGWYRSTRKRLTASPRYYLFDPGVTNALTHTLGPALDPVTRGRRFEQLMVTQMIAAISYARLDMQLCYWRTNHGAEVDVLFCRADRILAAAEIKSSRAGERAGKQGLASFMSEHPDVPCFILVAGGRERVLASGATVMDFRKFIGERLGDLHP
jgi:predicted AAA+ superfamily ATPase